MEDKNQYDQIVENLKNKKWIAIPLLVFVLIWAAVKFGNDALKLINNFAEPGIENVETKQEHLDVTKITDSIENTLEKSFQEEEGNNSRKKIVTAKIGGQIVDEINSPLKDVEVLILETNESVLTTSNGTFEFEVEKTLNKLKTKIICNKKGYRTLTKFISIQKAPITLKMNKHEN